MYIYHLHSYINDPKNFNGLIIRWLLEDDIYAESYNLDLLDLNYGMDSRHGSRSLIYPPDMTYRKWIEISKNYPKLILSLNFDIHSYKYKEFCKKILKYFSRNKNIIASACNECYEKRGTAEKVYQTALELHQALRETGRDHPIAFWNEKIYSSGERSAVEELLKDQRVKDICKYFAFQSLGTSNSNVDKYVKMAKQEGFKPMDIELATKTETLSDAEKIFKLGLNLGIKDIVIMGYIMHKKLTEHQDYGGIWGKYAFAEIDDQGNIITKDKYKLIKNIQQFKTKEEEMGIEIKDEYGFGDKDDRVIDFIQDMLIQLKYIPKSFVNFGDFDRETEEAVKRWQKDNEVVVTGEVSKFHIWAMIEQQINPESKFRQLIIYASKKE